MRGEIKGPEGPPFFHRNWIFKIAVEHEEKSGLPVLATGQPDEQGAQFFRSLRQPDQFMHKQLGAGLIHAVIIAIHLLDPTASSID